MSPPLQFINGDDGRPAFVVIPFAEFSRDYAPVAEAAAPPASESLLSADGLFIRLPHGGRDARLDLRQFIDAWVRNGTVSMAINKRQQPYAKFEYKFLNSLDPILRRCFLPKDSPYRDTMQATTAVVEALLETGLFTLVMDKKDYYRPVQCLKIDEEKAVAFWEKNKPSQQINLDEFCLP